MTFYPGFAKKSNSTKAPSVQGTTYQCTLKEPCSVLNPVIGLDLGQTTNPHTFNYASIGAFSRYYYITNWEYSNRLWWASLTVDVLATYKASILSNQDYIARAGTGYDGKILDGMYPASSEMSFQRSTVTPSNIWGTLLAQGMYVVGITNNDSNSIGAVSYYVLTPVEFGILKGALMTDTTWTDIATTNPDLGDSLFKSLFNPFQYFVSLNWFPFTLPSAAMDNLQTIRIGWWDVPCPAHRIKSNNFLFQVFAAGNTNPSVIAYNHPQANARGEFLNAAPYTNYRLIAPPWGEFLLDANIIANGDWVNPGGGDPAKYLPIGLEIRVDLISGFASLRAYISKSGGVQIDLLITQTNVAVPIQLSQMNTNAWGQVQNAVTTAANAASNALSLNLGGLVSTAATGILNSIENQVPHVQTLGSNGSTAQFAVTDIVLQTEHALIVNDALTDKGRPVCKYDSLGNYYGFYVQTVGAHVEIAGYDSEISMINSLLDSGVYLE